MVTEISNGHPASDGRVTNGVTKLNPIEATEAYRTKDQVAYELSKKHFDTPRRVKVILAGAGCSGLDFAHVVESGMLENVDLQIYEKNPGLGGTWYENRYPGCACDIPSHNYLVSSGLPTTLKRSMTPMYES